MEKFIQEITRQAGQMIREKFGHVGVAYTKKNEADVVTEADLASNRLIADAIRQRFPTHGIISEEQPESKTDAEYVWIADPLDGTRNFSTGTPLFGVMVALARHGVLELCAIHDPINDRLYFAKRGKGATVNGQSIQCSSRQEWAYSYGCTGASVTAGKAPNLIGLIKSAAHEPLWLNQFGSAAVGAMYVADGRRDWGVSFGGSIWDYAAAALLMAEAGCTVTNLEGKPWSLHDRHLVAANPHLHAHLLAIVRP